MFCRSLLSEMRDSSFVPPRTFPLHLLHQVRFALIINDLLNYQHIMDCLEYGTEGWGSQWGGWAAILCSHTLVQRKTEGTMNPNGSLLRAYPRTFKRGKAPCRLRGNSRDILILSWASNEIFSSTPLRETRAGTPKRLRKDWSERCGRHRFW